MSFFLSFLLTFFFGISLCRELPISKYTNPFVSFVTDVTGKGTVNPLSSYTRYSTAPDILPQINVMCGTILHRFKIAGQEIQVGRAAFNFNKEIPNK